MVWCFTHIRYRWRSRMSQANQPSLLVSRHWECWAPNTHLHINVYGTELRVFRHARQERVCPPSSHACRVRACCAAMALPLCCISNRWECRIYPVIFCCSSAAAAAPRSYFPFSFEDNEDDNHAKTWRTGSAPAPAQQQMKEKAQSG